MMQNLVPPLSAPIEMAGGGEDMNHTVAGTYIMWAGEQIPGGSIDSSSWVAGIAARRRRLTM
jgi:hypothetical protein